jgi:hypothetical protein
MLGFDTLNVLGFSFEGLYEHVDSALDNALAAETIGSKSGRLCLMWLN